MARPNQISYFKASAPRAETLMDRISRAAMEIVNAETIKRETKTLRLRKARLERVSFPLRTGPLR